MTPNAILLNWLASVERSDAAGYVPIDLAHLPDGVRAAAAQWSRRFLVPAADPWRHPGRAQHTAHLSTPTTNDLVRSVHNAFDLSLTVIQSLNFVLVRVAQASPPNEVTALAHVNTLAAVLLAPESGGSGASFRLAVATDRGPIFSSSPGADPMTLADWQARIDAGVRDGVPFFFVYKKVSHLLGYEPGGDAWFDQPFRDRYGEPAPP